MSIVFYQSDRDCTATQGRNCKGAAVNFGGWDEFTVDNGQFRFPHGMLSSTIASLKVKSINPF